MNKPPATEVRILFCPVCGRSDRYKPLKASPCRHHRTEGLCPGQTEWLSYKLDTRVSRKAPQKTSKPKKGQGSV